MLVDINVSSVTSGTFTIINTPLRGSAGYSNPAAADYHLSAASDAIDKGNVLPPLVDLDGVTRPQGVAVDIGAYEFVPSNLRNQTITFGPLADKLVGDAPFGIAASATSGLPVSFASLTPLVCTTSGSMVTLVTTGTCTIQAGQPGDGLYNPAPPVSQAFAVKSNAKSDQIITFGALADKRLGDLPFALNATASSSLPVSYTENTPGVCTVNGNVVTLLASGSCAITATQEGNAAINPATPMTRSFGVRNSGSGGAEKIYLPVVLR